MNFTIILYIWLYCILFCGQTTTGENSNLTRPRITFLHGRGRIPVIKEDYTTIIAPEILVAGARIIQERIFSQFVSRDQGQISSGVIRQRLDHFDGSNTERWNQVYWINSRYYKKDGPVFLYISTGPVGEDLYWIGGAGALPDWILKANRFGALCFVLEHRYYGESRPTLNLSMPNLKYLNTYQAMADITNFIEKATVEHNLGNAPWVLFGCSYAGALAAWTRLKFPHLVSMAVASGAPLQPKMDFSEYAEEVSKILQSEKSACVEAIGNATETLEKLVQNVASGSYIKDLFNVCEDFNPNDKKNIAVLFAHLAENIFNIVQESKVNRGFSKKNLTSTTICDMMTDRNLGDFVSRYASIQRTILQFHGLQCLSIDYNGLIESLKDIRYSKYDDWRQWSYQVCNEFGFYTTSNSPYQPFGHKFDLDYYFHQCTEIFGDWLTKPLAENNIAETLRQYGGRNAKMTKVIFTYGTKDPWKPLGATSDITGSKTILIEGSSHCADFYTPDDATDSMALKYARSNVNMVLEKWIAENSGSRIRQSLPTLIIFLIFLVIPFFYVSMD